MRYVLCLAALVGGLLMPSEAMALILGSGVAIDTFDGVGQWSLSVNDVNTAAVDTASQPPVTGILGLESEVVVVKTSDSNPSPGIIKVESENPGALTYSEGSGVDGYALLIYDGIDATASTDVDSAGQLTTPNIDTSGLGGVDLTQGNAQGFILDVLSFDPGQNGAQAEFTITVYDNGTSNVVTYTEVLDSSFVSPGTVYIPFLPADLGILANAGAVTLSIDLANDAIDTDLTLTGFSTGVVPEPISMAAWLGLAGVGGLVYRRRRQQQAAE